jgi:hypothetical protein
MLCKPGGRRTRLRSACGCAALRRLRCSPGLPQAALDFVNKLALRFGAPHEPIILRNGVILCGDETVTTTTKAYNNTNTGAIFKNDHKVKETDRDYSGTLDVGGTEYWISGWTKTSAKGTKYLSLSLKPKEPAAQSKPDFNDSVPFE